MKKVVAKATKKTLSKSKTTTRKKQPVVAVKKTDSKKTTSAQVVIQNKLNYTPKVSVIIPVYNVEKYLRECLDSVVNQTLKEIEVICVDDGSTDNSLEILKEYAQKDNRITVVSRENKGVGYTRNQAIKLSKGDFVAFMDPDDYYPSKEVLSVLYSAATNNDVQISGGSLIVYDENLQKEIKRTDFYNFFDKNKLVNYTDFQYDYGYQRFIFDRQMLIKNNVFFPEYKRFQDPPFMVNAFICAERFYAVSDYTYAYRWAHQNINWTEEKVFHLLSGLCDDLNMAITNNLEKLYDLTLMRIKKDYKAVITGQSSDRINQIKQDIMDICLKHAHDRYKKDLTKYKVSVVLPIYNAEPYLRECLDSVTNQTLKDIEIICVNDGSTDNSLDIIKEYANKDKRIKYIDKPNAGYGQTMNCGIDLARGEYIGIVEPDDFIKPDMYETLYNKAKELDLDVIKADYCEFLGENKHYKYTNKKVFNAPDSFYNRVLNPEKDEKILYVFAINPAGIFKRSFIEKYQIRHNETPGAAYQDNGFWAQTTYLADKIYFLNQVFYCYRQDNPNQSMKKKNNVWTIPTEYHFIDDVFAKHKKIAKLRPLYFLRKYLSYIYHMMSRLDVGYWHEYLTVIGKEFKKHEKHGDIDKKYFSDNQWADLQMIMDNPAEYIKKHRTIPEIIISLTSYPARIGTVHQTIKTLLNQSMKADKVILWLAPEQFPNREKDLPKQLLALCDKGLTIDWYHDIKSYKKLIPALQKYPEAIIVTADDDILYSPDWLIKLVSAYSQDKSVIWAHRAHRINDSHIYEYNKWTHCIDEKYDASYNNFCTTGGGVLYPPHCFYKDVCDENKFMKLCPTGDDIWFWAMLLMNNKKIKLVNNPDRCITTVEGTQEDCLWTINETQNDKQLQNIISAYPNIKKMLHYKTATKLYLLFPYYLLANMWMKVVSIPLAKFKKHTKQVWYSHSARGRMDKILQHIESVKKDLYNQVRQTQNQINTINSRFDNITRKYDDNYNKIQQMLINRFDGINAQFNDVNSRFNDTKQKIDATHERFSVLNSEPYWANVYHDTIINSSWLQNKSVSPGRWAVSYIVLYVLYRILDEIKPQSILECGLGQSSKLMIQYADTHKAKLMICEQNPEWLSFFQRQYPTADKYTKILDTEMVHIVPEHESRTYAGFKSAIKGKKFNLVLIDGPVGTPHYSRPNILDVVENLDKSFVILLDDMNRVGEQETWNLLKQKLTDKGIKFTAKIYSSDKSVGLLCSTDLSWLTTL